MNKFNILRTSTLILSTLIIAACEGGEGSGGDSPATKSGAFALSASSNLIEQNSDNLPIEINYQPTDTSKESAINAVGIPNDSQCTLTLSQAKLKKPYTFDFSVTADEASNVKHNIPATAFIDNTLPSGNLNFSSFVSCNGLKIASINNQLQHLIIESPTEAIKFLFTPSIMMSLTPLFFGH